MSESSERGPGRWTASAIFLATTLPFAWLKPLTNDEIYTLRVAIQPTLSSIWSALANGADNLPPLDYWVRHAAIGLLGPGSLALRLPSIIAVWIAMLCVYTLVARSLGHRYAFGSALLFLIVGGYEAALQTRGYALLLCSFAVSMIGWQAAATGRATIRDQLAVVGGLTCALYSHYYGVLHALAFALAAITGATRRVSLLRQPSLLIAVSGLLSLPLIPLVQVASRFSDRFWTPVTLTSALGFYPSLLAPAMPSLIVIALVAALVPASDDSQVAADRGVPRETVHALCWFAAMPVAMFVMARLATGAFLPRYALAAGAAVVILSVVLTSRIRGRARQLSLIVAAVPLLFMIIPVVRQVTGLRTDQFRTAFRTSLDGFQRSAHQPVIIGDDGVFVELSQTDTTQRLTNCYFLYEAFPGKPTNVDRAIRGLLQVWPIRAVTFDAMKSRTPAFAFIGEWDDRVLERSRSDGAKIESRTDAGSGLTYWHVTF